MGSAIVLSQSQLLEFKYQLRILIFRLKSNGILDHEIKVIVYDFYGFHHQTGASKPKIVISLTGSINSVKIESREDLESKIKQLYLTEGLYETDIELRIGHLHSFYDTIRDGRGSSKGGSPDRSKDSKEQELLSGSYEMEKDNLLVSSMSFEESAEEAYVRQQDEKRKKVLKSKIVAVEIIDYLKKGPKSNSSPMLFSPDRRVSRSSLSPDSNSNMMMIANNSTQNTPIQSTGSSSGKLPVIVHSDTKSDTSKSPSILQIKSPLRRSSEGSSNAFAKIRQAVLDRRLSGKSTDASSPGSSLLKADPLLYPCAICNNIFGSLSDLNIHVDTAEGHLDAVEQLLTNIFEFCDPHFPTTKISEDDLPYKFMITRRKLFNETREAYKADFYMHMSQNCVEVVLLNIGRDKKNPICFYFDNSKLNGVLHRQHGIMRNTKTHHEALSSYVIDRLQQDKKSGNISFVMTSKDPKDLQALLPQAATYSIISAATGVIVKSPLKTSTSTEQGLLNTPAK